MSKSEKDIKVIFYELYSYNQFGGHTINKSLQKKIENLRNQMAVNFYNLKPDDKSLEEFSEKYMIYDQPVMIDGYKTLIGKGVAKKINDSFNNYAKSLYDEQKIYKKIVNKIIRNEELSLNAVKHISMKYCGQIMQVNDIVTMKKTRLIKEYHILNQGIYYRAIYEWAILLSRNEVKVYQCKAPNCDNLFNPTPRGRNQKYCSNACKARAFRQQHSKKNTSRGL